jgi:MFS family permease
VVRKLLPNVYEGWIVTGSFALIIVLIGSTFAYGFGTIFTPVITEFGWSNASVSFGFSLRSEVQGIGAPAIGYLVDRFGARLSMLGGVALMVIGLVMLSFMQSLWQFYFAMFVTAFGMSAAGGPVGLVAVASWFERRRARALSFMTIGGGVSGLFVVLIAWLVESVGWRDALRVMALMILVVGAFVALNVRSRPPDHHQPIDGIPNERDESGNEVRRVSTIWGVPPWQAIRSRPFLLIALSQAAILFSISAIQVHMIPYLESLDVSKAAAATALTVFVTASLIGRLGFGYLADKYDKRKMLAISLAIVAVSTPFLAFAQSLWSVMLVLLIIAPGFGGIIPVRPAMLADYFGTRYFGTVNGVNQFVITFGAFAGPLTVGLIVDATGEYFWGWLIGGIVAVTAVPMVLLARPPLALQDRYIPGRTLATAPVVGTGTK